MEDPYGLFFYMNRLYATSVGTVRILNSDGTVVRSFGSFGEGDGQFHTPLGIAVYEDKIYVVDQYLSRVQVFDLNGNFIRKFGSFGYGSGQFFNPEGIAVTNGKIYVSDTYNDRIQVFDLNGNFIRFLGTSGTGDGQFLMPRGIDTDGHYIYVGDSGNYRIQVFDLQGNFVRKFGSYGYGDGQFNEISGISSNASGNLFVLENYFPRVQTFDQYGNFISRYGSFGTGSGQFRWPFDIEDMGSEIPSGTCLQGGQPLYCNDGSIVPKCSTCGCSCGSCYPGGSCLRNPLVENMVISSGFTPYLLRQGSSGTISVQLQPDCDYSSPFQRLEAHIQNPDGADLAVLELFDDGLHGDGASGDLDFGNVFDSTGFQLGVYQIDIVGFPRISNQQRTYDNLIQFRIIQNTCNLIRGSGARENLNLAFISCNYNGPGYSTYVNDVSAHSGYLLSHRPYNYTENLEKINVYRVDNVDYIQGNCIYGVSPNPTSYILEECGLPEAEVVVLWNETSMYGYAYIGGYAVSSRADPFTLYHELGHSFGYLLDEYGPYYNAGGLSGVNCDTADTASACPQWCDGPPITLPPTVCSNYTAEILQCRSGFWPEDTCVWLPFPDPYTERQCLHRSSGEGWTESIGTQCYQGWMPSGCYRGCDYSSHSATRWRDAYADSMRVYTDSYGPVDVREIQSNLNLYGRPSSLIRVLVLTLSSDGNGVQIRKAEVKNQVFRPRQSLLQDKLLEIKSGSDVLNSVNFSFQQVVFSDEVLPNGNLNGTVDFNTKNETQVTVPFNRNFDSIDIRERNGRLVRTFRKEELQISY